MTNIVSYDLAIIGGGAGGLSLAAGAAQLGAKVVLLENHKMGGDCLNYGCVPSKALLACAKQHLQCKEAYKLGSQVEHMTLDFGKVMQHVKNTIATIAVNDSVERFESLGVDVIQGGGQFIDRQTLHVDKQKIRAKRFVIATGSSPFVPPIAGLEQVKYHTNETIFELTQLPEHLIVVGGGPIGCELAQAFAMLGAKVTLLEGLTILPKDEADCVAIVRAELIRSGIALYEQIKISRIDQEQTNITIQFEHQQQTKTISGTHLLIATGRRANVNGLGLEKAGVKFSARGIAVDQRLRSSNKKIYAIGDVAGSYQFTHMANYHAGIVLKNVLFRLPAKVDYRAVPWVTYTHPEMAHVGLLSQEAQQQDIDYQITEWPYHDNDRAQTDAETVGKIKVLTDHKTNILGVTIVGAHAGELILPWVIAIREKKSLRSFTDTIVPYPTLSELSKRAAGAFYTPKLFSKKVRTLVKWLLKLG